jgi:hypothetical protein
MTNLPAFAMLNQIRAASGIPPRVTISGSWYKDVNVRHEATDAFVNLWKLISDGTAEQAIAKARGEDTVGESDRAFH